MNKQPFIIKSKNYLLNSLPLTAGTICRRFASNTMHMHNHVELYYTLRGKLIHIVGDKKFIQLPGMCVIVPPFTSHWIDTTQNTDTPIVFSLEFDDRLLIKQGHESFSLLHNTILFEDRILPIFREFDEAEKKIADMLAYDMLSEFSKNKKIHFSTLYKQMLLFLRLICKHAPISKIHKLSMEHSLSVINVTRYIDNHFTEKLSLDTLSRVAAMSRNHFLTVFKKVTGMTSVQYINILKLSHAQHLLLFSKKTLEQIAAEIGFYDKSRLSNAFKHYFAMTPKQYKNRYINEHLKEDLETRYQRSRYVEIAEHFMEN